MKTCGDLKLTQFFLVEVWEAMYCAMLERCLEQGASATGEHLQDAIHENFELIEKINVKTSTNLQ